MPRGGTGWKEMAALTSGLDPLPPRKLLSKRVQLEMYAGKRQIQKHHYAVTMPWADYEKFVKWVDDWILQ